jgi:hypothetical protein
MFPGYPFGAALPIEGYGEAANTCVAAALKIAEPLANGLSRTTAQGTGTSRFLRRS